MQSGVKINLLGQAGVKLQLGQHVVYIDPYLSDSVEDQEGSDYQRLIPVPISPESISDANLVLITHEHLDHCDPATLRPLAVASPECKFIGPPTVTKILAQAGIPPDRLRVAQQGDVIATDEIRICPVPAAHPKIEMIDRQYSRYLGYVILYKEFKIYHAGDTSVHSDIIQALKEFSGIDLAFIPVNERNVFREERGIIGNMSVRDAFQFATAINVRVFVPVHWDMFALNRVYREELEVLYEKLVPPFKLNFDPDSLGVPGEY